MGIILICIIFAIILYMEVPGLIKNQDWRELAAFLAFLLPGITLGILLAAGIPVPNPVDGIERLLGIWIH